MWAVWHIKVIKNLNSQTLPTNNRGNSHRFLFDFRQCFFKHFLQILFLHIPTVFCDSISPERYILLFKKLGFQTHYNSRKAKNNVAFLPLTHSVIPKTCPSCLHVNKILSSRLMQILSKGVKTCYKIKIGFRVPVCCVYGLLPSKLHPSLTTEPLLQSDSAAIRA